MSNLAERIRELRLSAGMTQEEFGRKFGIVKSTVSLYESGKSTPNDQIKRSICEYFGVSLDYLVGISESRPVPPLPAAPVLTDEEAELLRYYRALNRLDQRWIMGQIVDLLRRKEDETPMVALKGVH